MCSPATHCCLVLNKKFFSQFILPFTVKISKSINNTSFLCTFLLKLSLLSEQAPGEEEKVSDSVPADPLPQSEALNADENPVDNNIVVVKDVDQLEVSLMFQLCVFLELG